MGLIFRRRVNVDGQGRARSWLNLSRSGVSFTQRLGRVSANSRGRVSLRLGKGFSWRIR